MDNNGGNMSWWIRLGVTGNAGDVLVRTADVQSVEDCASTRLVRVLRGSDVMRYNVTESLDQIEAMLRGGEATPEPTSPSPTSTKVGDEAAHGEAKQPEFGQSA